MAFGLPDKGVGADNVQSILFHEYIDILVAGLLGVDFVLSGCVVTAQGAPDMTVAVAKGAIMSNGALFPVTQGNVTITAADATNPRLDLIVANNAGVKAIRTGTPAANPKPPARSANDVVLAVVWVPALDTTIAAAQITDLRILRGGAATGGGAPIVLKKTTTPVTFNTNAVIQTYFTITLPSGLFLTGQSLRVRCGGSFLMNSGTANLFTLTIAYGGTTMYADATTGVQVASAVRRPWHLDFDLIAQSNTVQNLSGRLEVGSHGTTTPPAATTGAGAMDSGLAVTAESNHTAIEGAAAVDSDAADRTLTVQWTMSVSAAAIETKMDYATAELL